MAATCAFVAALGVLGLAFWKFLPEDRPIRTPIVTVDEQTQKQRLEMLNQIPAAPTPGTARPPAPPSNIAVTPKAQEAGLKAQAGVGPITLGGTPAGKALAAAPVPTALAAPTLKIGNPADADPMELAFHPSHFADPMRGVKTIGTAVVPAAEPRAGGGGMGPVSLSAVPASGAAGGPDRGALPAARVGPALAVDPYAEAVRLERARAFTMSLCTDLQGRIWIGSENTTPGDGTGGVQCFDPSKPPLQAFTQYLSNDSADRTRSVSKGARVFGGLGDDNAYAIACDLQGRIWVGHLNHGVSVFNGETWQNYEVVAGLSIPNSLSGPLGERIFKIVVAPNFTQNSELKTQNSLPTFHDTLTGKDSPMSGSVWMCTSAGLSIYFPSTDTWSYLTRADGLPSDQANSLAFGQDGTLYLATQCDGIAIASSKDGYKVWRHVNGPDEFPTAATGEGLPANLMNDILVTRSGVILAATTAGLGWSTNQGQSWQYSRAGDLELKIADKDQNDFSDVLSANIREDYCSAMAQDSKGAIWIGYRNQGINCLAPSRKKNITALGKVVSILCDSGPVVAAAYGSGLTAISSVKAHQLRTIRIPFPLGQDANAAFAGLRARQDSARNSQELSIAFLADDHSTQGDWIGRYGRQYANLCAANSPFDDIMAGGVIGQHFSLHAGIGPHNRNDTKRNWLEGLRSDDISALWNPFVGARRQSMWDDHGESYPQSWQGPNLEFDVAVPAGLYRLSLYFEDYDGQKHALSRNGRDFNILAGLAVSNGQAFQPSVHVRTELFQHGVYKQFLLAGEHAFHFEIQRNSSLNATLTGLFLDRWAGPPGRFDGGPLGGMGHIRYDSPPPPDTQMPSLSSIVSAWVSPTESSSIQELVPKMRTNNLLAYRAIAGKISNDALAGWRWTFPIWNPDDRRVWAETVQAGWQSYRQVNPKLPAAISMNAKP